jgi:hypothetical protein
MAPASPLRWTSRPAAPAKHKRRCDGRVRRQVEHDPVERNLRDIFGGRHDAGKAIAVGGETSIVVSGQTGSGNVPVSGSLQNSMYSVLTSFITKIAPSFTLGVAYGFQVN